MTLSSVFITLWLLVSQPLCMCACPAKVISSIEERLRCTLHRADKGQLISKCLSGDFNFLQYPNENKSHRSKIEFVCSFFGGNVGLKNLFDFVWPLTFEFAGIFFLVDMSHFVHFILWEISYIKWLSRILKVTKIQIVIKGTLHSCSKGN